MKDIKSTAEFLELGEDEILAALDAYEEEPIEDEEEDEYTPPADPIVAEVVRLIGEYSVKFEEYCANSPELPNEILDFEPEHTIEQIAYEIFLDAVMDAFEERDSDDLDE